MACRQRIQPAIGSGVPVTKRENLPRGSRGVAVLEKRRRLFVIVDGDEIVVTSDPGFRAVYCRRPHHPQLIVRRRTDTDDQEVIAQAWQAANDKARELGWL